MNAVLVTLFIFLVVGLSFLGWGKVAARTLKFELEGAGTWSDLAWLGVGLGFLVLQVIHFVAPIQAFVTLPLIAAGVVVAAKPVLLDLRGALRKRGPGTPVVLAIIILLLASWIALRSITQVPDDIDAGGYHFATIRWIRSYRIVPGLGNLHFRLAFNSAFFLLVAALDFEPLLRHGHQIANSLLLVLAFITVAAQAAPLIRTPNQVLAAHPYRFGGYLLALPPMAYLALSRNFANPSPDFASTILQVVVFLFLCDGVGQWIDGARSLDLRATVIFLLAAALVAMKLSNLAFALAVSAFVFVYLIRAKVSPASTVRIVAPAIVMIATWCVRGILLSGAPLFPSAIGYVPTWWAVPREVLFEQSQWIRSWARAPGLPWEQVLASWDWFQPWLEQRSSDFLGMVYPLGVSGVLCLASTALGIAPRRRNPAFLEWAVLAPPVAGLAFWFTFAPDVRFANALFFLLPLASCLLFLVSIKGLLKPSALAATFCLVFLVGNLHLLQFAVANKWALKPCATTDSWFDCVPSAWWRETPAVPTLTRATNTGLVVILPAIGGSCWDAALPCTQPQAFNPRLGLAKPGVLDSGFLLYGP